MKITSSGKGWPSPSLGGGSSDEDGSDLRHDQRVVEVVHVLSENLLQGSKAPDVIGSVFAQFGLLLLQEFLAEWSCADDLPMNPMVGKILTCYCLFIII